jgi:hypothetical protein
MIGIALYLRFLILYSNKKVLSLVYSTLHLIELVSCLISGVHSIFWAIRTLIDLGLG